MRAKLHAQWHLYTIHSCDSSAYTCHTGVIRMGRLKLGRTLQQLPARSVKQAFIPMQGNIPLDDRLWAKGEAPPCRHNS